MTEKHSALEKRQEALREVKRRLDAGYAARKIAIMEEIAADYRVETALTDLPVRLIPRLHAELDNVEGVDGASMSLMLSRADAAMLLLILEYVQDESPEPLILEYVQDESPEPEKLL